MVWWIKRNVGQIGRAVIAAVGRGSGSWLGLAPTLKPSKPHKHRPLGPAAAPKASRDQQQHSPGLATALNPESYFIRKMRVTDITRVITRGITRGILLANFLYSPNSCSIENPITRVNVLAVNFR